MSFIGRSSARAAAVGLTLLTSAPILYAQDAVQNHLSRDRLIGLLNLPELIGQPCGPGTPISLDVFDKPSAVGSPSGAITYRAAGRTPNSIACGDGRMSFLRKGAGGATAEKMPTKESGYELAAAIVYERSGPWFRIALPGGSGWIRRKSETDFLRYPELLVDDQLPFMASGWDGRLWSRPGAASAKPALPKVKRLIGGNRRGFADVWVLAVRRIGGEAWVQVRVIEGHCGDGEYLKEPTIDTGWIPAWRPTGQPAVWFYSRGC